MTTDHFSFTSNTRVGGQTDFSTYFKIALPGMVSGMGAYRILPHTNDISTADTWTVTPPATVDPETEYSISINGVIVKFKTEAATTSVDLMKQIFKEMQISPVFYSLINPSLDPTTNVITLQSRVVIDVINVQLGKTATNNFSLEHTVTPTISKSVPFGRFVGKKNDYKFEQKEGVGQASLIDALTGYEVLGITHATHHTQRTGIGQEGIGGYAFGDTMNVMEDTGTIKGIYVECVESDILIGDMAYVAISPGNEGKLTNTPSGALNISTKARIISGSQETVGNKYIALVQFNRYGR